MILEPDLVRTVLTLEFEFSLNFFKEWRKKNYDKDFKNNLLHSLLKLVNFQFITW